jgi:para-nitrobenzyl esterase
VQKQPVYRYLFDYKLENDPEQKALGPIHTIEHPFLFSWEGKYRPTDADRVVQDRMVNYWTRFIKTGSPNGGDGPKWPAISVGANEYLEISASTAAKSGPESAHCDYWDKTPMLWPHM